MSIESFFTLQSLSPGQSTASVKGAGASGDGIAAPAEGKGFVDMILDYMKAYGEAKDEQIEEQKEAVRLEKLLADNPELVAKIKEFSMDSDVELSDTLAMNQQALDDIFGGAELAAPITTDTVEAAKDIEKISDVFFVDTAVDRRPISNEVRAIAEKIHRFTMENSAQLVASDLTPQQLTQIQGYLTALQNGEVPEDVPDTGAFVGLIKLLPPQVRADIMASGQGALGAQQQLFSGQKLNAPANDFGSQFGTLTGSESGEDFASTLKYFKLAQDSASQYRQNAPALSAQNTVADNAAKASANNPLSFNANLLSTLDPNAPLPAQLGLGNSALVSAPSAAQIANPVTQSYSAGTTHPATQLVATALQKSAHNGQNTQITLRLDPPELGRIQARLQFGNSNALQTSLTVEQPETYAMLQRDSHALERALQDMGLDLGDGINLELAEQGFDFDHGNQRGGGHDSGASKGAGGQGEEPLEIIQSTMSWHVDPQTGHTHYNIWA